MENSEFVKKLIRDVGEKYDKMSPEELKEHFENNKPSDISEIMKEFLKDGKER